MKKNPYEENIEKKCVVCNHIVMVHQYGGGECQYCGWYQNKLGEEYPDRVVFPNVVSYNKAKQLIKEVKNLKPSIEDFAGMFMFYGEVEFNYKGIQYDMFRTNNEEGSELASNPTDTQYFTTIKEFINNAKVFDGKLLKDIWNEVENPKYM